MNGAGIRGGTDGDAWFARARDSVSGDVDVFCFPFAGGNPAAFLPWQALLGPRLRWYVAQLPGRGARLFEPALLDLNQLVAELMTAVAELSGARFVLFGHSLGALIAFEVARALRRANLPGPDSLWVCGSEGPQTRTTPPRLHDLPGPQFVAALVEYGGTAPEVLADEEMMRLLLPGLRADFALVEGYVYRAEPPLDLPVHLLRGDRDQYVDAQRAAGWQRETSQPVCEHLYPADHFFVLSHQTDIAAVLRSQLLGDVAGAPLSTVVNHTYPPM